MILVIRILLLSVSLMLSGCLGGLWTGANLFYNRHNVYKSLSDFELNANATRALHQDDYLECPKCHIDVAVFNGDILLAGHVDTATMRDEAYRRVKAEPGYRHLFNELTTDPVRTDIARDSWITAKICSKMIADDEISPNKFKVVTSDQIVYIMGDVMPHQAELVVAIAQDTVDVKRVVKLMNYYHLTHQAKQT